MTKRESSVRVLVHATKGKDGSQDSILAKRDAAPREDNVHTREGSLIADAGWFCDK